MKKAGDKITFGKYEWRVLDVKSDRMLIITEYSITNRPYYGVGSDTNWEKCHIREYLNTVFYDIFNDEQKNRIMQVTNENKCNPWWYDVQGGNPTQDHVFLLSLDEVVQYFGDRSSEHALANSPLTDLNHINTKHTQISDKNNEVRVARKINSINPNYEDWTWWLRSPGNSNDFAAVVQHDGAVGVYGFRVGTSVNVRPALWLKFSE